MAVSVFVPKVISSPVTVKSPAIVKSPSVSRVNLVANDPDV